MRLSILIALPPVILLLFVVLHILRMQYRKSIDYRQQNRSTYSYVYFYRGKYELPITVKIGKADDPVARLKDQRTANPFGLYVYGVVRVRNGYVSEARVHHRFKRWNINTSNEWYWLVPQLWLFIMLVRDKQITKYVREEIKL